MSIREGDVILTKDHFIGVIRYIGFVNKLSKGDYDDYIGVEIKVKRDLSSYGNTNGSSGGIQYFKTSANNGLFIKQQDIIRRFPPEQLLDLIPNKTDLFPQNIEIHTKQEKEEKQDIDTAPDLDRLRSHLLENLTQQEVITLIAFCEDQAYDDLETVQCDIDEYDAKENSSIIVDHMKEEYNWNEIKQQGFVDKVNKALEAAANNQNYPISINAAISIPSNDVKREPKKEVDRKSVTPRICIPRPSDLPTIYNFHVPMSIMKQRDERSVRDIISCFKRNKIPNDKTEKLRQFCRQENIKLFDELQHKGMLIKFISIYPELTIFEAYINKCIHELSPPIFLPRQIEKKDETECKALLDEQCEGLIKHDKPLIHFILLSEFQHSQIVDIADRIYIQSKRKLSKKEFTKQSFFKYCDIKQISTVYCGLTHYHHRFLPEFPHRPLKYIVDKISGYQKYCILLSRIIHNICNIQQNIKTKGNQKKKCHKKAAKSSNSFFHFSFTKGWNVSNNNNDDNDDDEIEEKQQEEETMGNLISMPYIPFMIDMMIIPPGCLDRCEEHKYDASGPDKVIGDIAEKLRSFNINFQETKGLTNNNNNFDEAIESRISKQIIECIKKLTNNLKTPNQRICIVIDRRWRINCKNDFIGYEKLRKNKKDLNGNWYNKNSDTIYVYSPKLINRKKTYHEFNNRYIHETLLYLTKRCIIPSMNNMHIGGDTADGFLFNISAHVETAKYQMWYKYDMRWYVFLQGAAIRFFPDDMVKLWTNYFADNDEDKDKMELDQIKTKFKIDLEENDSNYKRWYCAIKRSSD